MSTLDLDFLERFFGINEIRTRLSQLEDLVRKIDEHMRTRRIWDWKVQEGLRLFNFAKRIQNALESIQKEFSKLNKTIQDKIGDIKGRINVIQGAIENIIKHIDDIKDAIGYVNGDLGRVSCESDVWYQSGKGLILEAYKLTWHAGRLGYCVAGLLEKNTIDILGVKIDVYVPRPDRLANIVDSTIKIGKYALSTFRSLKSFDKELRLCLSYINEVNKQVLEITNDINELLLAISDTLLKTNKYLLEAIFVDVNIGTISLPKPKQISSKATVTVIKDVTGELKRPSIVVRVTKRVNVSGNIKVTTSTTPSVEPL